MASVGLLAYCPGASIALFNRSQVVIFFFSFFFCVCVLSVELCYFVQVLPSILLGLFFVINM